MRLNTCAWVVLASLLADRPLLLHAHNNEQPWIEVVSWKPRAFVYHGFLTHSECDHIIALATPRLTRSGVTNADGSANATDDIRTSFGAWIRCACGGIGAP